MLTEVIHIGRLEVIEGFHVDAVRLVFHGEVGDVEDACLQPVGVFLTTDDEHGLGVIVDVLNLLDVELGEDGHHDCSIGEGCVEGNRPVGVILVADGYLLPRLDVQLTE